MTVDKTVTPRVGPPQRADRSPVSATRCLLYRVLRISRHHRAAVSVGLSVTVDTGTGYLVCSYITHLSYRFLCLLSVLKQVIV